MVHWFVGWCAHAGVLLHWVASSPLSYDMLLQPLQSTLRALPSMPVRWLHPWVVFRGVRSVVTCIAVPHTPPHTGMEPCGGA